MRVDWRFGSGHPPCRTLDPASGEPIGYVLLADEENSYVERLAVDGDRVLTEPGGQPVVLREHRPVRIELLDSDTPAYVNCFAREG